MAGLHFDYRLIVEMSGETMVKCCSSQESKNVRQQLVTLR